MIITSRIHAICLAVLFMIIHLSGGFRAIRAERNSSRRAREISQIGSCKNGKYLTKPWGTKFANSRDLVVWPSPTSGQG
jgi:hypothetical protein